MATLLEPKQQFYMLAADELKDMYRQKDISAKAYILLIVKIHKAPGWQMIIDPKEFCQKWEIKKTTFYDAISKLKVEGQLSFEVRGKIVVWHGTDIGRDSGQPEFSPAEENTVRSTGIQSGQPEFSPVNRNEKSRNRCYDWVPQLYRYLSDL